MDEGGGASRSTDPAAAYGNLIAIIGVTATLLGIGIVLANILTH